MACRDDLFSGRSPVERAFRIADIKPLFDHSFNQ